MEVVAATHSGPGSAGTPGGPFQRHNVEEWQRLDRFTGVLETARRESGCWKSDQQQYGKVVDSCSLVSADGSAAQRQLRQLEVFQSRSPGASLQVIRAHTHTSTSSSNKWGQTAGTIAGTAATGEEFENLQLALNPLDLSSQKTKASVGRSGSIGGRRPPSRPRSLTSDLEVTARLQKVSRLCQQLHEEAVHTATNLHENLTKRSSSENEDGLSLRNPYDRSFKSFEARPSILERQNGDGSVSSNHFESSEPLRNGRIEDWRQTRLNTALRGNNVDLEALDQILKSISSSTTSSSYSDKVSLSDDLSKEEPEKDSTKSLKKRQSFITAESLQEVRGRLRRLSSPVDEFNQQIIEPPKEEEPDDGIVAEDTSMMKKEDTMPASNNGVSRVRSYVYGMEAMLHNKKPIIGTGSLESRSSNKANGSSMNRSEDWYNRRKSYGFEQVHNQQIDHSNSISLRGKNKIESSTDSGICRSTEIVVIPSVLRSQSDNKVSSYSKVGNSTVINLGGDTNKNTTNITEYPTSNNISKNNELFNVWNRRSIVTEEDCSNKKDLEQITITIPIISEEAAPQNGRRMYHRQISEGTSVSVESNWSNVKQNSPEIKRHSIAVDETKYDNKYSYPQLRRTSLALEPSKSEEKYDLQDDDNINNFGKKHKKVEFCKTEVHFAAESGRVNIVETDEKPPPTQNFRRRRRNSNVTNNHVPEDFNKNGLPIIHFGDTSYEKKLFGVSDSELTPNDVTETYNKDIKPYNVQSEAVLCNNNVTVSAVSVTNNIGKDYEQENTEFDNPPRGILKNRMIKPRPYILGDDNNEFLNQSEDPESTIWGVRLRPVHKEENPQIWRSTVTVQNTSYNIPSNETIPIYEETPKPEFQKLLHSLRPARKSEPSITSPENTIERSSPILDLRRSSWSVADRVKQVEDMKQTEIKGYSTRVNFGGGEATVVENGDLMKKEERHPTWPRQEETHNKDFPSSKSSLQPPQKKPDSLITSRFDKNIISEAKVASVSLRSNERRSSTNSSLDSPQLERKPISNMKKYDIARTSNSNGYLSSPFLVGKSNNTQKSVIQPRSDDSKFTSERSAFNKVTTSSKDSPSFRRKNVTRKSVSNNQTYTKSVVKNNYYNEISSPSPTKKVTEKPRYHGNHNKPDLLQFSDNREYVNLTTVIQEENDIKKESAKRPESPIYENIDDVINNLQQMEKESTMLQELTKAADQILQAVNGYTDEDSTKVSTDSEDESRKHRLNFKKTSESLSTISETKSWKQLSQTKVSNNVKNPKNRVKPTSSTSSIESIKESKPVPPVRMNRATKLNEAKKKITGSNSELSKATKARRLQRASSREALLQSHGSSSEDITSSIDIRKPRLVRRSKTQTQTATEEISTKKSTQSSVSRRTQSDVRKSVERIPVIGLQEIRHKTAVSTIKSTAEKNASREKALKAKEELKKKSTAKSTSITRGLTSSSNYTRPSSRDAALASRSSSLTMKKYNKSELVTKY